MNIRQLFRRRTATVPAPADRPVHYADTITLTITEDLEVLLTDGSTWDPCPSIDSHECRTVGQLLGCVVWESLASIPPAPQFDLHIEPTRIVLPGVEPFVAIFYGPDEDHPNGRTLDETGRPLCWRVVAEAAGATAADGESIGCPSCQHPKS
uniref:Uncharacterized protein n=1 Tax=Streptomyces sp. 14R-10 TaxID=1442159 RepID=W0FXZ8_9ACTN|nr:hypothetical protein [Streptomyces sp. 14R-10]AHF46177.1 hypothetical protein pZL1.12c [Streptomyces sp. 14R-10]